MHGRTVTDHFSEPWQQDCEIHGRGWTSCRLSSTIPRCSQDVGEQGKEMKRINRMMLAAGLMLIGTWAIAQDDPAVPKICYADMDALTNCYNAQLFSPKAGDNPEARAAAEGGMKKIARLRASLPYAVKNSGLQSVKRMCETDLRQAALHSVNLGLERLQNAGDSDGAAQCKAAIDSLGQTPAVDQESTAEAVPEPSASRATTMADPSVPPVCYRVANSIQMCLEAALNAAKDSSPANVPAMQKEVEQVQQLRSAFSIATRKFGAQHEATVCNGPLRAQMLDTEMQVSIELQQYHANQQALECRQAMDMIR